MKSLLSSSLGRQSPSFAQRMEAKKRQEVEDEARKRRHNSSSPAAHRLGGGGGSGGLSSSYNASSSSLRAFLSNSTSPSAAAVVADPGCAGDASSYDDAGAGESMVVIEGFLTKQGQRFKTWKRRWCVVLADPPSRLSSSGNGSCTPASLRDDDGGFQASTESDGSIALPLGRKAKLYYAKQPQSRSSRGEVTLDQFSVLDISTGSLDEEAMALQSNDLMPTSHCFCVNTQKRVYYFCCDTAEELVRWQRALQSLLPYNQNREDYDDPQARGARLEREVRRLFQDLREVIGETGVKDGDDGEGHQDNDNADDPYANGNGYMSKGKEAKREDSNGGRKKSGHKKEERRREKEREWLRVIEAEMQQVETIDEEEERHEEWVRLKQALTKGMERALLRSDRRRAEFTLRAAAAKASSITADDSDDSGGGSEGETAKKQKNEDGKTSKNESDVAARKNENENGGGVSLGRRQEGTRRGKDGDGENDDDDGWNSDGFDTSREATMAREIMGLTRKGDDEEEEDGGEGDRTDDDDDDVEEEEDSLLESDKRRHAKRKRKSRRGRNKAPTRRIYSYGQETADVGFEGEPETEQSFAGPGANATNYGAAAQSGSTSRKSLSDRRHHHDFNPTPSSSSFWSCFCC